MGMICVTDVKDDPINRLHCYPNFVGEYLLRIQFLYYHLMMSCVEIFTYFMSITVITHIYKSQQNFIEIM